MKERSSRSEPSDALWSKAGKSLPVEVRKETSLASFPQLNSHPIIEIDTSGAIIFYNDAALQAAEKLGLEDLKGLLPAGLNEILNRDREQKEQGSYFEITINHTVFAVHYYYSAQFQAFSFFFIDITEHKRAEEALKESEHRYRTLFENMLNGYAYCRMHLEDNRPVDFTFIKVNPAFETSTGLMNVEGKKVSEVIPGLRESDPHLFETFSRVALTSIPERFETYVEALDMWFSISVYSPQKEYFVTIFDVITERKLAEEALRQAEEKYRSIFENAVEGIFQSTPEGRYISANPAMARMFGYESPEELLADITDIATQVYLDPQRRADFRRLMAKDGVVKDFEYQIHRKGGGSLWLSENARAVLNEKGEILYFEGFMQDISERKEAENKLAQLRQYQELILNSAWEGIVGLDPKGRITFANLAAARMFGYGAEELLSRESHSTWHHSKPDGSPYPARECPLHVALEQGETIYGAEDVFWRQDGTSFPVRYSLAPILERGEVFEVTGGVLTFFDTSQQKEEQALTRSLLESSPVGVYLMQDRKFVLTNQWFHKITGYNEEELADLEPWILVHPEDREGVRINALKMLRGESFTPSEFRCITKGGETKWVMETVTSVQYQGKRATLGYFLDITERKELEAQFFQAQKMEAVGRLAGGVAHDLNNILGTIMGHSAMMMMSLRPEDELSQHAEGIEKGVERAAALTRQLLAFSRKKILRPQLISLNEIVSNLETMIRRIVGEDLEFVTVLDPSIGTIKTNPAQIEQVIMNLVVNARDAMPTGGKLTIETANITINEAYVQKNPEATPGDYVLLSVSDTGIGMDAEMQVHIFDPFFTTKEAEKGTGLGLSTVHGIVKQSGGHIKVSSRPGQGAVIKIYFPRFDAAAELSATKATVLGMPMGAGTILVVEDDEMLRELICDSLRRYGYSVIEAPNGAEALRIGKQHQGPLHLMLTDVVMPGIDGMYLANSLMSLFPELKVLFMTGYTDSVFANSEAQHPNLHFIEKPFKPSELVRKLRETLNDSNN